MASAACCDTSFLFSLYGRDGHTADAASIMRQFGQPLSVTVLNEFELVNALQLAVFRRSLDALAARTILAAFERDLTVGKLVEENCNLADVVATAKELSILHTAIGGYRSFDIMHIATALRLNAGAFITFDIRQKALAASAGLPTMP